MDILSHGLWAAAAAQAYNQMYGRTAVRPYKLNALLAAFWGISPDLFAFTIPFAYLIINSILGKDVPRMGPPDASEPPPLFNHWTFQLASTLYNYSHSLIIFFVVLTIVLFIRHHSVILRLTRRMDKPLSHPEAQPKDLASASERSNAALGSSLHSVPLRMTNKRVPFELLGWLLHILIDIPTHSYSFYPTPFLWPISQFKFDGISWAIPWFMIANYSALALVFLSLFLINKRRLTPPQKTNTLES